MVRDVTSEDEVIGRTIRSLREARAVQAQDLAAALGVSPSKLSRWESGEIRLRASELGSLADALGVSPLAVIDPESFPGRLAVAARPGNAGGRVWAGEMSARVNALGEFHQLFAEEGIGRPPSRVSKAPDVSGLSWRDGANRLAEWAWNELGPDLDAHGDARFDALVFAIEYSMDIDVLVEPFDDETLGLAITAPELPMLVVNSARPRRQALFTLAHEFGHALASDGQMLWGDRTMAGGGDSERRANAFAAAFLMPEKELRQIVGDVITADTLGQLLARFGVSVQTLVFRLHNAGLISAGQRDMLRSLNHFEIAQSCHDEALRRKLAASDGSPSFEHKPPQHLLNRAVKAYRAGVCSIGPVAGLMRVSDEVAMDVARAMDPYREHTPIVVETAPADWQFDDAEVGEPI